MLTSVCYRLEERRKVKGQAYYEKKKAVRKIMADAKENASGEAKEQLEQYGY